MEFAVPLTIPKLQVVHTASSCAKTFDLTYISLYLLVGGCFFVYLMMINKRQCNRRLHNVARFN